VDWNEPAQITDKLRALVYTVMNIVFSESVGDFLTI